jgi:[phosphatase 2A protein]-leucine-carboxy methyltransferase
MVEIYSALDGRERERIERLELLDEQELLVQLFQHYCICVAWKGDAFHDISLNDD